MPRLKNSQVYPAAYYFLRMIGFYYEEEILIALSRDVIEIWQIEELAYLGQQNKDRWPTAWEAVMEG